MSAENELVSYFLTDAEASIQAAVDGFGCERTATTEDVGRLLLAQGMLHRFEEEHDAAAIAFASARRIAPTTFNSDFGDEARAAWEGAEELAGKPGIVAFHNLGSSESVWLDGVEGEVPLKVLPGLHLIQAGAEKPRFARLLEVDPGQELTVTLRALATTDGVGDDGVSVGIDPRKKNFVPAVVTGGAAVALYGGAIGVRQAYDASPSDGGYYAVDGLYGASVATGVAAGALAVLQLAKK